MTRTGLGVLLLVALAGPAPAADGWKKDETFKPSVLSVSELLEQMAKSPLGPGEARLLRAVADLVEKEQEAKVYRAATASPVPVEHVHRASGAVQAVSPIPIPTGARTVQRNRVVIRLCQVPAVDAAKALQTFLAAYPIARGADASVGNASRAVLIAEPMSNSLVVSAPAKSIDALSELIAKLDAPPPAVVVDLCIAEWLPRSRDGKTEGGAPDALAADKAPSMEKDGAAWLAWAKKHGRLEVLGRPQIMTLNNQRAFVKIGQRVPAGAPEPAAEGPTKENQGEHAEVGLSVELTPSISPEGHVLLDLDLQRASVVRREGTVGPTIGKTAIQTTLKAKEGQTIVVGGPIERAEDGERQLVIAVTPQVSLKR
jgi:type II secretory pathway component GspD/PulD (secretin)